MKSRYLLILAPLALAACDEKAMQDFRLPWDKAPEAEAPQAPAGPPGLQTPEISPLKQAIEVEGGTRVAVATADASTVNVTAYSARGVGVAWAVDVSGNRGVLKVGGQRDRFIDLRRIAYAKGVEYVGTLNGSPFVLNIRGTECQDSTGARQPMSASLRSSVISGRGCAAPASADIVPPAPKAAPKPPPKKAPAKPAAPATPATPATPPATPTPPAASTPAPATPVPAAPAPAAPAAPAPAAPAAPATPTPTPAAPLATGGR